jgi:hypothetical protein
MLISFKEIQNPKLVEIFEAHNKSTVSKKRKQYEIQETNGAQVNKRKIVSRRELIAHEILQLGKLDH